MSARPRPPAVVTRPFNMHSVIANTALRAGSDAVKVAVRIDGHCEDHAWIEGSDRAWLAGMSRLLAEPGAPATGETFPALQTCTPVVTGYHQCHEDSTS